MVDSLSKQWFIEMSRQQCSSVWMVGYTDQFSPCAWCVWCHKPVYCGECKYAYWWGAHPKLVHSERILPRQSLRDRRIKKICYRSSCPRSSLDDWLL